MNYFNTIKNKNIDCNNFSIFFGKKILDNCFDFNLTEENYLKLLRFVKNTEKWNLVSKKNIKIFYYYDLKLIIDDKGNLLLEKDIVKSYYDFLDNNKNGFRILANKEMKNLDVNIFPGLDKINDIRKIREIIFEKDNTKIKFLVVNHSNKEITFESVLYSNKLQNLSNVIKTFTDFLNLNIQTTDMYNIDNNDKMSRSII